MNPRRSATVTAAFYPAVVIAGWVLISLASSGSPRIQTSAAAHAVDKLAPSLTASADVTSALQATAAPATPATAMGYAAPGNSDFAIAAEVLAKSVTETKPAAEATVVPVEPQSFVLASADPAEILPPAQVSANTADPQPEGVARSVGRIEIIGECLVVEPCIDQYLFALYARTPKEDTIKEIEKRQVTVKRRGKQVTVTRSATKLVDNDFTWKDPNAAERAGMSMADYVIGGMDKSFKLKLFHLLQAAENAGLQPGITSAFRDDYRQSIASGLKAASNRSYHGGSLRGGYGHGLAADIVSVNGASRDARFNASEALWKWVDSNGKQFGIGRPYLAFDPPHVGPTEGPEYVSRRGRTTVASADVKKRDRHAAHAKPNSAKRPIAAKPSSRVAEAR